MAAKKVEIPRSKMTAAERRARSRLAQVLSQRGVIRGTLLLRKRKCGKVNWDKVPTGLRRRGR